MRGYAPLEKKKFSVSPMLVLVIVLGVILAAVIALTMNFCLVNFKLYSRKATQLDLRGQEISASSYEKLCKALPDCEIYWDIPFQSAVVSSDATEVNVNSLAVTQDDILALKYLPNLKTIHAENHEDYETMAAVQQMLPQVQVLYQVPVGETRVSSADETAVLGKVTAEDLGMLDYLPNLKTLAISADCDNPDLVRSYCAQRGLDFGLRFRGELVDPNATELTLENVDDTELPQLRNLPNLKKLHLISPQAKPESVFALKEELSNVDMTWEVYIAGEMYHSFWAEEELNLSKLNLTDLSEVEHAVSYLPQVKQVFLGEPSFSNDELAAFRDRMREQCKVVWQIRLGESDPIRTDITYFFPGRDGKAMNLYFKDDVSYNLRYCEDLICVDLGHLGVSDVSFLEGLTNLEYLILAHTGVTDLHGIENCKKLKFLEIHWTGVRDLAPLKGLTALEDLNFGMTWPDVSALKEMPWLKNIYMIDGDRGDAWELSQALPNTRVVASGNATVGGNWRKLPNYYAMRDALHAPYMNG